MPVQAKTWPQTEWVPQRALCALSLHSKLVLLLLEKLDLPLGSLQELRLASERGRSRFSGGTDEKPSSWALSAGGALYVTRELRCPLWLRLWNVAGAMIGQDNLDEVAAGCLSSREVDIISEVEVHISAALRHLGHASSHHYEVGELFSADLRDRRSKLTGGKEFEAHWEDASTAEGGSVQDGPAEMPTSPKGVPAFSSPSPLSPTSPDHSSRLGSAFASSQNQFGEAVWTVFLYVQVVSAIFQGDVLLLAAWALRLLGLPGPWSLRRLQEFAVGSLELLVEHPNGLRKEPSSPTSLRFFWDSCATYLTAPVIPRLQVRLKKCITSLRETGALRPELVGNAPKRLQQSIATVLGEGEEVVGIFDGTGDGLEALRENDELHEAVHRALREAVVARVDRGCPLDVRNHTLNSMEALSSPPLLRTPMDEAKRKLLFEALASVPQQDTRSKMRPSTKSTDNWDVEIPQGRPRLLGENSADEDMPITGLDDVRLRMGISENRLNSSASFPFCCSDGRGYE